MNNLEISAKMSNDNSNKYLHNHQFLRHLGSSANCTFHQFYLSMTNYQHLELALHLGLLVLNICFQVFLSSTSCISTKVSEVQFSLLCVFKANGNVCYNNMVELWAGAPFLGKTFTACSLSLEPRMVNMCVHVSIKTG